MNSVAKLALVAALCLSADAKGNPGKGNPKTDMWTNDKRKAAIPRDFVLDSRGKAYLKDGRGPSYPYYPPYPPYPPHPPHHSHLSPPPVYLG